MNKAKCIYCNESFATAPKTFEHTVSKWLLEFLDAKTHPMPSTTVWADGKPSKTRAPIANTLGKKICETCNNGWLHEIDNSCADLVKVLATEGALFPSDDCVFTQQKLEQCHELPRFLYKIAMNYLSTTPFAEGLTDYFDEFYKAKNPQANTLFFISKVNYPSKLTINHSGHSILDRVPARARKSGLNRRRYQRFIRGLEVLTKTNPRPFKMFIQFGHAAFVVANIGALRGPLIYDPNLLHPMFRYSSDAAYASNTAIPLVPMPPSADTISARLLNSIMVSFENNEQICMRAANGFKTE